MHKEWSMMTSVPLDFTHNGHYVCLCTSVYVEHVPFLSVCVPVHVFDDACSCRGHRLISLS